MKKKNILDASPGQIEEKVGKKELAELIEAYKIQSPEKYAQRKERLQARLDALK